jgi:hypothetical protein
MERKLGRVLFPYLIVFVSLVSLIAGFGMMADAPGWQIWIWAVAGCLVVGAGMFSFFEVRRLAGISRPHENARTEAEADRFSRLRALVEPSTGEPCVHHEDQEGSPGIDQGQLTSRIDTPTPLFHFAERGKRED